MILLSLACARGDAPPREGSGSSAATAGGAGGAGALDTASRGRAPDTAGQHAAREIYLDSVIAGNPLVVEWTDAVSDRLETMASGDACWPLPITHELSVRQADPR